MSGVSVVMAACNGEKYLPAQLDSVLMQLDESDEVILTIDPSTDRTWQIAREYARRFGQVKVFSGPSKGIAFNFENGLNHVSNDYVFLCDQDDVWMPGKVKAMKEALDQPGVLLAVHDCIVTDENLKTIYPSYYKAHKSRKSRMANLIRNSFIGACIAFRKDLLNTALPFPGNLPMHDQWLGLAALKKGKVAWLDEPYVYYRRHGKNASGLSHSSLGVMIDWRWRLYTGLAQRGLL
ncbi:MAG: glycosyltransferase family 2 protein [Erysipelotrichaceae bacterium]|nr:glycosyltransferase family 2 protein [Erysipelotrichaceae bacterium]